MVSESKCQTLGSALKKKLLHIKPAVKDVSEPILPVEHDGVIAAFDMSENGLESFQLGRLIFPDLMMRPAVLLCDSTI